MGQPSRVRIDVHLEPDGAPGKMGQEVRSGLARRPRQLPSKYFYDKRGSELFERITALPEYYLTRAELSILEAYGGEIARITGAEELVELGSGAATKTRLLLEAGLAEGSLVQYLPVEVSQDYAERSARDLVERYPSLAVHAVVADFERDLLRVPRGGRRLVAFLGSTIGNFPEEEAIAFLSEIGVLVGDDDWFLLGTDLVKDVGVLEAAYNDSRGLTAEFNRNILHVVNRHLDGDFDPTAFEHLAYYNAELERIESYLRSTRVQQVRLGTIDLEVELDAGERLWTEVSCKYTVNSVRELLRAAGLEFVHWFTDDRKRFALSLARRSRRAPLSSC